MIANNTRKIIKELNKEIVIGLITSMRKNDEIRLTLTVPETAKLLRINVTKAYELVKQNQIPSFKCGNRILIPIISLIEWLDQSAWSDSA